MGQYHCLLHTFGSASSSLDKGTVVHRRSCLAITFAYCCKAQFRGTGIEDEIEDGAALVHNGVISQEELDMIATQNGWQPYYCIDAMRVTISKGLVAEEVKEEWKMNAAQISMEETICNLSNTIGGCIRVDLLSFQWHMMTS